MTETEEIKQLLTEIRDLKREHLTEYRKVTSESLELQRQAMAKQQQAVKLSSRIIVFVFAFIACVIFLLFRLMAENF